MTRIPKLSGKIIDEFALYYLSLFRPERCHNGLLSGYTYDYKSLLSWMRSLNFSTLLVDYLRLQALQNMMFSTLITSASRQLIFLYRNQNVTYWNSQEQHEALQLHQSTQIVQWLLAEDDGVPNDDFDLPIETRVLDFCNKESKYSKNQLDLLESLDSSSSDDVLNDIEMTTSAGLCVTSKSTDFLKHTHCENLQGQTGCL